jgi:hypothetical protein
MSARKAREAREGKEPDRLSRPLQPATPGAAGDAIASTAAMALAFGFYVWMLGGPQAMENIGLPPPGFEFFAGLPAALAAGAVVAVLIAAILSAAPLAGRRGVVALAAAGLYLSAAVPAIGRIALVLGPLAMAAELGWLELKKPAAFTRSLLVALHAGAFVSALGFFHDWARYAHSWRAFVRNVSALGSLLL